MAPERDGSLPPVQPTRRMATVRGLNPRLWSKRFLAKPVEPDEPVDRPPAESAPTAEAPLTYDEHAHLHGGEAPAPRVDLQD